MKYKELDARLDDWETVAHALLMQPEESLSHAARRALRRSERLGIVTVRTEIARLVADVQGDPWPRIEQAARIWRGS